MAVMSSYQDGDFCWSDLGTTDLEKSKLFYSQLFGWDAFEMPGNETGGYSMFLMKQGVVAGYYPMMKEQIEMHIPCHWMSYIKTSNINATLNLAKENGGIILVDTQTIPTQGSMALVQAPDGGIFGLWQPESHFGSVYKGEHGSMCWFEYGCRNRDLAIKFFESVFGWNSNTSDMGGNLYTVFSIGEQMVAGLYLLPEEMKDVPSHWLPYFEVGDIDKAIEVVGANSGNILMAKMFVEGVGHFAVIQDNVGAVIGLIQSSEKC